MYTGASPELSLELLWVTEPIQNQPYNARIRTFLIARAIGNAKAELNNTITQLIKICASVLTLQKYEFVYTGYSELAPVLSQVKTGSIKALIKQIFKISYCLSA